MSAPYRSAILGTGLGIPKKVMTNFDLEKIVETSDEWIRTRTGIVERRFIDRDQGQSHTSIAVDAARSAMAKANVRPEDLDFIICATATPDTYMPNASARIAEALGSRAGCIDMNSACSGFVVSLHNADGLVRSGLSKRVLVVGAEVFSSILNWNDRGTCVLFGDGAGAVVLGPVPADDKDHHVIIASKTYNMPDPHQSLAMLAGASRTPFNSPRFMKEETPYITMNGQEVFKNASRGMHQAAKELLEEQNVHPDQIKWFIPHQANLRIIEMVAKLLEFPMERVYVNVNRWGNTSAATIPICLGEMEEKGMLKKGDLLLLDTFGGGFIYGATLLRW